MRRLAAFLILAFTAVFSQAQLAPEERQGLTDALYLRNLRVADLDFSRREPGVAMPLVAESLDHPLTAAERLMRWHRAETSNLASLLANVRVMNGSTAATPAASLPGGEYIIPQEIPEPLRPPVARIVNAIKMANAVVEKALTGLNADERRILVEGLPRLAAGPDVRIGFASHPMASEATLRTLLAKVDVNAMVAAGQELAIVIDSEIPDLRDLAKTPVPAPIVTVVNGVPVEIGGSGPDVHSRSVGGLCIDLGGNDTYTGRYGGAAMTTSVLIDLGGNDTYDVPDMSIGAGVLGIGLAYDLGGHDRFRGQSICFGAGIAGLGAFDKEGGDDDYRATSLAEGYGGYAGVGLLLDGRGDDRYSVRALGQGVGQSGGTGWLIDRGGNDIYVASELAVSSGSRAQGYGEGGVGLLTDLSGDDRYHAMSLAQAAGQGLGLGSLYDGAGRDSYEADRRAQSFARDQGAAYLFDLAGDDIYAVRGSACHGTAESRSVAFLLDREGDDLYAAGDGRPGLATDASLALFLDSSGRDRYVGTPAGAVGGRHGDSLGLFVDLSGSDGYPDSLSDGEARIDPEGSVAYDAEGAAPAPPLDSLGASPGSAPDTGADAIDALFAKNDLASANRLVAVGVPALRRLLDAHLRDATPAQFTTISLVARRIGEPAKAMVAARMVSTDEAELRRLLVLAGTVGASVPPVRIVALVKAPGTQREAVEAAGLLRVKEALADVLPLTASADPSLALAATLAMDRIGDESAVSTATTLATSPQLPIREAAMRLLSRFTASGTAAAQTLLASSDERGQRLGIELLGRIGTSDSIARIVPYLSAPAAGVRIQAMQALNGRVPAGARATLASLRNDLNPLVRAVAARIDVGR